MRGTAGGEVIFNRDFSAPTGEDRFDKSVLPAVMQVRAGGGGGAGRRDWGSVNGVRVGGMEGRTCAVCGWEGEEGTCSVCG